MLFFHLRYCNNIIGLLLLYFSPQGAVDELFIGVGQVCLVIHPLPLGVATPGEGWPELQFRPSRLFFSRAHFTSFYTRSSLLTFFFCFFVLFHSSCSHARVFEKTLLHEFHISSSHTECICFFSTVQLHLHKRILGAR